MIRRQGMKRRGMGRRGISRRGRRRIRGGRVRMVRRGRRMIMGKIREFFALVNSNIRKFFVVWGWRVVVRWVIVITL